MARSPTWSRTLSRPTLHCARVPMSFSSTRSSGLASSLSGSVSMPLVKNGKISGDAFVHVADDAPLPGDGAVLISAARFLDDPEALSRRGGGSRRKPTHTPHLRHLVAPLDRTAARRPSF